MACNPKPLRKLKRREGVLTQKQMDDLIEAMARVAIAFQKFGGGVQSDYERKA